MEAPHKIHTPAGASSMSALAVLLLLLVVVSSLALVACGGSRSAPTSSRPVTGPSPVSPGVAGMPAADAYAIATPVASPDAADEGMAVSYSEPPYAPARPLTQGVIGWEFKPTVDIDVTQLGCFDGGQDGLKRDHRVGIFDAQTRRLVAGVTVGPGSALDGAFRWAPLNVPATLRGGHSYVIGAQNENQKDETLYEDAEGRWPVAQWAPTIAFGGMRTSLGTRQRTKFPAPTNPRQVWAMIQMTYMSPNFKFRQTPAGAVASDLPRQKDPGTLVYTRITEPNRNYDVCMIRTDGTGFKRLTDDPGIESHAYWSPDGKRIVYGFSDGRGDDGLTVMDADGYGKTELIEAKGGCLPHWSPNGRQIVFDSRGGVSVVGTDGLAGICLVNFASGLSSGHVTHGALAGAVNVMDKPVANPCWTPDGRILFFSGWPTADLYVVDSDGSGLAQLTWSAGLSEPAVSPDGMRVAAYVKGEDRIVSARLDGGAAPVILLNHARRYFPSGGVPVAAWSPDGRKLVLGGSTFGETRGSGLYIVNADGSGLTRVPHVTHAVCADWRPR